MNEPSLHESEVEPLCQLCLDRDIRPPREAVFTARWVYSSLWCSDAFGVCGIHKDEMVRDGRAQFGR